MTKLAKYFGLQLRRCKKDPGLGESMEIENTHQVSLRADSRLIYHPRFANAEKTRIKAIVRTPDGRMVEMEGDLADGRSPLIRDLLGQYTRADIERFTDWEKSVLEAKQKVDRRAEEDRVLEEEREILHQAKAKALAMDEVQNCNDKRIKQKIRKSKNAFEIAAWISIALQQSLDTGD
jgi:hypothetical protein